MKNLFKKFPFLLLFLFPLLFHGQSFQGSLYYTTLEEKIQQQVQMQNLKNSGDWESVQQLVFLRDNFPFMATDCDQQIAEIYALYSSTSLYNEGSGSQQIMQQQSANAPRYSPNMTPEKMIEENNRFIRENLVHQQEMSAQQRKAAELMKDINEAAYYAAYTQNNKIVSAEEYYQHPQYIEGDARYFAALEALKAMLAGKQKVSLRKAFWLLEWAYGKTYLTEQEYNQQIDESVNFIKTLIKQSGGNVKNNVHVNRAIQSFLNDSLTIKAEITNEKVNYTAHKPFTYDYIDYQGEKDLRNHFVTKALATGTGQCNSLPILYMILSQELGAKSYMSYAPQHSFIKYLDENGTIQNYETTIGWHMNDNFYINDLHIKSEAQHNKIYLDTINYKQMIASAIFDLAAGYMWMHGNGKNDFPLQCVDVAMPYFRGGEGSIQGWFIRSMVYSKKMQMELYKNGDKNIDNVEKYPIAYENFKKWQQAEAMITQLGYQDMPKEAYEAMLARHEEKGKMQITKNAYPKERKQMFVRH